MPALHTATMVLKGSRVECLSAPAPGITGIGATGTGITTGDVDIGVEAGTVEAGMIETVTAMVGGAATEMDFIVASTVKEVFTVATSMARTASTVTINGKESRS